MTHSMDIPKEKEERKDTHIISPLVNELLNKNDLGEIKQDEAMDEDCFKRTNITGLRSPMAKRYSNLTSDLQERKKSPISINTIPTTRKSPLSSRHSPTLKSPTFAIKPTSPINTTASANLRKLVSKKKVSFSSLQSPSAMSECSISSNSVSPDSSDDENNITITPKNLTYSKSLDNDSQQSLPEFNKRPLTDTPVHSSITSPQTAEHSDNDEADSLMPILEESPLTKTKNISHLNLTDLKKNHDLRSESISPMTKVPTINVEKEDKDLLELPKNLGEENKNPSLEKLKNLLLEKATKEPKPSRSSTLNIAGQTSSKTSPDGKIAKVDIGSKLVIVMVGLPARGKSYITNKLTRYLNWLQHDCRVFNVGNTRRLDKMHDAKSLPEVKAKEKDETPTHDADFFNPNNSESINIREKWAMDTLDQLLDYIIDGTGSVGIFDATNSTRLRRLHVLKRIQERTNGELKVLYLESICSDPSIIESNIRLKLSGPDYKNMDPDVALKDFEGRLHNYEKAYETIDEEEEKTKGFQYVKMINVGRKIVSYNCQGFLASQTVYFLLNFNLCERQIWITRHGESIDNLSGRIGGDSHLTKRGDKFARTLARFMDFQRRDFRKKQLENFSSRLELKYNSIFTEDDIQSIENAVPTEPNFCVWTSMLLRAIETGQYFDDKLYSVKEMRMLNELGGGKFEGLTYNEIQNKFPQEFDSRLKDKLSYRYPGVGGESYLDVFTRLRPLITEIERTTDHLLIISHRVVLRVLLAYFLNLDKSSIGELDVPLHTLYCLESKPYGTDYRMYEYDERLDWFVTVSPEHKKNMREVGVNFRERKYSIVPTAPPSSLAIRNRNSIVPSEFSLRRSLSNDSKDKSSNFNRLKSLANSRKPIN